MEATLRTSLVKLNYLLSSDDVSAMKFMCKDVIPFGRMNEINTSLQLFEALEQRGKLLDNDVSFLEYLLKNACGGKTDVLDVLDEFKASNPSRRNRADCNAGNRSELRLGQNQQLCNSRDLSDISIYLQNNLGREYLMVLRRLGVQDNDLDRLESENAGNIREVIHKALGIWHSRNCNGSCIVKVIEALKGEKRNDLAKTLAIKYVI